MSVLYFDTSAVNRLNDDLDRVLLLRALRREVCAISVFTAIELASTPDSRRRSELLSTASQLVGDSRPLAVPGDILRRAAEALAKHDEIMDASMWKEWDGLWLALRDPNVVDSAAAVEAQDWKLREEKWYQDMVEEGRPDVQSELLGLPKTQQDWITQSPSHFMKHFCRNQEFLVDVVCQLAPPNVSMTKDLAYRIIRGSDAWRFYLAGIAFAIFGRSVRPSGYGKHSNPGSIDTQQSIYLAGCDMFITADQGGELGPWGGQLGMMRSIIPFGANRKRIAWHFDRLREWCLSLQVKS